jgi:hypothetical protein
MKFLLTLAVAACALTASTPATVAAAEPNQPTISAVTTTKEAPPPAPNRSPLMALELVGLAGLAVLSTGRVPLSQAYLFNGITYGPSTEDELAEGGTEVPEDFPEIDDKTGEVLHQDLIARRNLANSKRVNLGAASGPANAAAGPGSGKTVSGKTAEELEKLDKAALVKLAEKAGVNVQREGVEGAPLKEDYVRVLSGTATTS